MEIWFKISLMLCVFGFLKEFKPSEPFFFDYLIGPWTVVNSDEVIHKLIPVGTYSYLVHLLVVFLVTDFLRYKALIVILGLLGVIIWSMILSTTSLIHLQVVEGLFGAFMSCEVAYYTYIYAKVDKEYYLQVSSYTRAAILAGRAISGILAQIFISFEFMNYRDLNYLTLGAMILGSCWSLFLPTVNRSIYFHQNDNMNLMSKVSGAFTLMKSHFVISFSNKYVLKWSIWWALTTAGCIQVQLYIQSLWSEIIDNEEVQKYNGAVEAAATLMGFFSAVVAGFLEIEWKGKGEFVLSICAIVAGGITVLSSQTSYVFVSYICYAVYCIIYQFMITIASSEIAQGIAEDSYGLIFGINTFAALLIQTIMTLVFVEETGLGLTPRNQNLVYSIYHFLIALIFIVIGIVSFIRKVRNNQREAIQEK